MNHMPFLSYLLKPLLIRVTLAIIYWYIYIYIRIYDHLTLSLVLNLLLISDQYRKVWGNRCRAVLGVFSANGGRLGKCLEILWKFKFSTKKKRKTHSDSGSAPPPQHPKQTKSVQTSIWKEIGKRIFCERRGQDKSHLCLKLSNRINQFRVCPKRFPHTFRYWSGPC